jgi:hypothetical protein
MLCINGDKEDKQLTDSFFEEMGQFRFLRFINVLRQPLFNEHDEIVSFKIVGFSILELRPTTLEGKMGLADYARFSMVYPEVSKQFPRLMTMVDNGFAFGLAHAYQHRPTCLFFEAMTVNAVLQLAVEGIQFSLNHGKSKKLVGEVATHIYGSAEMEKYPPKNGFFYRPEKLRLRREKPSANMEKGTTDYTKPPSDLGLAHLVKEYFDENHTPDTSMLMAMLLNFHNKKRIRDKVNLLLDQCNTQFDGLTEAYSFFIRQLVEKECTGRIPYFPEKNEKEPKPKF